MYCGHCGNHVRDGARFCSRCGEIFESPDRPAAADRGKPSGKLTFGAAFAGAEERKAPAVPEWDRKTPEHGAERPRPEHKIGAAPVRKPPVPAEPPRKDAPPVYRPKAEPVLPPENSKHRPSRAETALEREKARGGGAARPRGRKKPVGLLCAAAGLCVLIAAALLFIFMGGEDHAMVYMGDGALQYMAEAGGEDIRTLDTGTFCAGLAMAEDGTSVCYVLSDAQGSETGTLYAVRDLDQQNWDRKRLDEDVVGASLQLLENGNVVYTVMENNKSTICLYDGTDRIVLANDAQWLGTDEEQIWGYYVTRDNNSGYNTLWRAQLRKDGAREELIREYDRLLTSYDAEILLFLIEKDDGENGGMVYQTRPGSPREKILSDISTVVDCRVEDETVTVFFTVCQQKEYSLYDFVTDDGDEELEDLRTQLKSQSYGTISSYTLYRYVDGSTTERAVGMCSGSPVCCPMRQEVIVYDKLPDLTRKVADLAQLESAQELLDILEREHKSVSHQIVDGVDTVLPLPGLSPRISGIYVMNDKEMAIQIHDEEEKALHLYTIGTNALERGPMLAQDDFTVAGALEGGLYYYTNVKAYECTADLYRCARGETTLVAEQIYGLLRTDEAEQFILTEYWEDRGEAVAAVSCLDDDGRRTRIAGDVQLSSIRILAQQELVYLADGDLYYCDDGQSRCVARDVRQLWVNEAQTPEVYEINMDG